MDKLTTDDKKKLSLNAKALNVLFCALGQDEFARVSSCKSAKEAWKLLKATHEGDKDTKATKIALGTSEYENFKMKARESVQDMNKRFDLIVNNLSKLNKVYPTSEIVEAVEIPLQSEPRNQRRTALEDSGIRARKCTLTAEEFRKAKRLALAPGVTVRRPTPEQLVYDAPSGFFAVHLKSHEYGFRFPLHQLVIDFFQHFDLLPCQVVPKSHRYLAGFLVRCQGTGVRPDLARFLLLFRLAKSSGRANFDSGSYASIFQRQKRLFKTRKDSAKSWKGKFIFVSLSSGSPFREIMLSSAERMKLMFPDAPSGNSQAPPSGSRPPTPPVKPTPETAQKKKRKETASAAEALQGSESPMMKDFGHPKYVKAAFPARAMMRMVDMIQRLRASEDDRSRAYVEIANLNEALKAAKEQARQAEERAQQLAEDAAHKARQEARDQAVAEFLASDAFQEEAFTRMNDLLKAWGQTHEGKAFARSEGTSWYNLGLFRAQQVLSERFLAGEDFPEPCDIPDELDTSIYYPNGGNSAGEQPSAE
ncbi:unnamed protein product [Cuscuta campestris]|uniref:Transposase (putative) gypsy type domain-containing protein n=1 Tax=Cuscuta campestris TaxID=132261 RepID=A0A484M6M3_9ASTE|nr:unnamed protein product [Cuscuta campestris]